MCQASLPGTRQVWWYACSPTLDADAGGDGSQLGYMQASFLKANQKRQIKHLINQTRNLGLRMHLSSRAIA